MNNIVRYRMNFDLKQVPFSRFGSYFAFSVLDEHRADKKGLYLRTVRGDAGVKEIFRIDALHKGKAIPYTTTASPASLKLETAYGYISVCISEPKTLRFRGKGAGMRLTSDNTGGYALKEGNPMWQFNMAAGNIKLMMNPYMGECVVDAPWNGTGCARAAADFLPRADSDEFECILEEFESSWEESKVLDDFDTCVARVGDNFKAWLEKAPPVAEEYGEARELAAYINWASVVDPLGNFKRPSMLMSKNWMTNVWSWDHCFNAISLYLDIDQSWNQLMTIFDNQDQYGALPDYVNNSHKSYSFCKPPIHGWALKWLLGRSDKMTGDHLKEIYGPLGRWTRWWFNYRDSDGDGIPQYNHGNDCGWDNSTVFKNTVPVESPDLCAFLIIQTEALAMVADRLGRPAEHRMWTEWSEGLLLKLVTELWDGKRFIARDANSHQPIESKSLLTYMPVILGRRLPADIIASMVSDLKEEGKFLTAFGFATESTDSLSYAADGYWRGPIWAPSTMIIIDGLAEAGEIEFVKQIARRFCDMAKKNGMAENYDALTGEGLRDRAYTWTSSVFLILANQYL